MAWRWVPPPSRTLLGWLVAISPFLAWSFWCFARGDVRPELAAFVVGLPLLVLISDASRKLLLGLYPVGSVGLLYDAMKFVQNVGITAGRVHDCDLRAAEATVFGFGLGGGHTVHDWFQTHHADVLDVFCAIPYGTFIYAMIATSVYLYFHDFAAVQRFGWTFFAMNILGFITYHVFPAAPPWYFHAHGCVVDMSAHANEGARLAHVDALLGISYFHSLYGRSHDVFGAVPSLHVAYPLLVLREGWRYFGTALRSVAVCYAVTMAFGAVYLDHHWIIDVCCGVVYVAVAHTAALLVVRAIERRRKPITA